MEKILYYSIVFLGFSLHLGVVARVGEQSLVVMIFTLSAVFVTALPAGKAVGIDANTKILIGVGISICGGSAIAAVASIIDSGNWEVPFAISTIFLFNIVGVRVPRPRSPVGDVRQPVWALGGDGDKRHLVGRLGRFLLQR